jgi:hypothetical protein
MTANPRLSNQMPKWLLYAIAGKLVAVVLIVVAVLWYAGIL